MGNKQEQIVALVRAFGELSIPEKQAFFKAVCECQDLPSVVREVATDAANVLGDYLDWFDIRRMS